MTQICQEFSKEYPLYDTSSVQQQPQQQQFGGYPGYPGYPNNQINMGNMQNPNHNQTLGNEREQCLGKIKKKYFDESVEIAKKMESDLNDQRTSLVELRDTWLKLVDEEAKLSRLENDAPLVISEISSKIGTLQSYIQSNESVKLSADNISFVLTEADEKSKVLLDVVTTNKAIEDTNLFLENVFRAGKLDTELFLRYYKDNCDKEFFNKHLIKKLTSN
eukprot:CAMPEP_0176435302 /NCGR_PEP_ID=MMETSP0127-20121128/17226_1 /TAXON_ID=938130 /ORGANISM="Platyophrya macrostoma, Strain WH" /LENGTH=218 /DNA_ID=CAMNT_0017818273 /DNA_START=211 /DNA_END=867 /DNA_ORIENTATION=-